MTATRRWSDAAVEIAAVSAGGMSVSLAAEAGDRRAIADRLRLPGVDACTATFALRPEAGRGIAVEGRLSARLVRRCVVTGDPMAETIDQPVECLVVAEEPAAPDEDGTEEPDYEVAPDGRVDLAELAVQYLAVSMAAYPRGPGADDAPEAFGAALRARSENAADAADAAQGPFAGLGDRLGMPAARAQGAPRSGGNEDEDGV